MLIVRTRRSVPAFTTQVMMRVEARCFAFTGDQMTRGLAADMAELLGVDKSCLERHLGLVTPTAPGPPIQDQEGCLPYSDSLLVAKAVVETTREVIVDLIAWMEDTAAGAPKGWQRQEVEDRLRSVARRLNGLLSEWVSLETMSDSPAFDATTAVAVLRVYKDCFLHVRDNAWAT